MDVLILIVLFIVMYFVISSLRANGGTRSSSTGHPTDSGHIPGVTDGSAFDDGHHPPHHPDHSGDSGHPGDSAGHDSGSNT